MTTFAALNFHMSLTRAAETLRRFVDKFAVAPAETPAATGRRRKTPQQQPQFKYRAQLDAVANGSSDVFTVDLDDLAAVGPRSNLR